MPGRGAALEERGWHGSSIEGTRALSPTSSPAQQGVAAGKDLRAVYRKLTLRAEAEIRPLGDFDHRMPFDVTWRL